MSFVGVFIVLALAVLEWHFCYGQAASQLNGAQHAALKNVLAGLGEPSTFCHCVITDDNESRRV
jgi:hypothetical protein